MLIGQKTWLRGRGYFALYGYSQNFKNLLRRKCRANFHIIVEMFLGRPSIRFLQAMLISRKAVWRYNFCLMATERYWPSWASCSFPNKNAKIFHFLTSIVRKQGNYLCQVSQLLNKVHSTIQKHF